MRVRRIPGAYEALLTFAPYFLDQPSQYMGKWHEVFGNQNPIHAEFGGGKGKFIIEMALKHPDINFVMVDAVNEVALKAAERLKKANLPNVKVVVFDLRFVKTVFAEGEIERIYLNFSDPWPKKRHYKRRLTYRDFLDLYRYVLKEDGWIHFKTDNRQLFQFSLNEFAYKDLVMQNISLDLHSELHYDNVMTEYEQKFSKLGFPIFRIEVTFRR